ncbi:MAG: FAD/NAD(P)-binding protein, partial [Geminicoccaceae bacterium]
MRIAIIGAGFSGCQLTLELLRRSRPDTEILLFDGSETFGTGVAFAARHSRLVLNTRVANMSVFEHDRSHFLRWLWAKDLPEHPAGSIPPSGHAFVSRGLYGRYVSEV